MKKILMILVVLIVMVVTAQAASLKWDASTGAENYSIYIGNSPDSMTEVVTTADTAYQIANFNLSPGVYYFAVTAINKFGASGMSNIVEYDCSLPDAPTNLRIVIVE